MYRFSDITQHTNLSPALNTCFFVSIFVMCILYTKIFCWFTYIPCVLNCSTNNLVSYTCGMCFLFRVKKTHTNYMGFLTSAYIFIHFSEKKNNKNIRKHFVMNKLFTLGWNKNWKTTGKNSCGIIKASLF